MPVVINFKVCDNAEATIDYDNKKIIINSPIFDKDKNNIKSK